MIPGRAISRVGWAGNRQGGGPRRDGRVGCDEWLEQLVKASWIETPTRAGLAIMNRKRPNQATAKDWMHPHDAEAWMTEMKDGRTHLAHAFDQRTALETEAVVKATVQTMEGGNTASLPPRAGRSRPAPPTTTACHA